MMESFESDSVIVRAAMRWGSKIELRRDEAPWLTIARTSSSFSLNGQDYLIKRGEGFGSFEFSRAGEKIVDVKGLSFDYGGKTWAMKGSGLFSPKVALERNGEVVGEFKRPGGFYLGTKVDVRMPRDLPDEFQVMLIWFYFIAFVTDGGSS